MVNSEIWNAEYIDQQYTLWQKDPKSVSPDWDLFFKGFELGKTSDYQGDNTCSEDQVRMQAQVEALIYSYRDIGHLLACLDPLVSCPTDHPLLNIHAFGLSEDDLDMEFWARSLTAKGRATLKEILNILKTTYCRSIGVEYMHLQDPDERKWLQGRMETNRNQPEFDAETKHIIYNKLCHAALFESHLHRKYLGQKRFSLEGADVIIPMLDDLIQYNAGSGVKEMVMGMAHRGRLNVLTNILMKLYTDVFREFNNSDHLQGMVGAGDVKYHKGYEAKFKTRNGHAITVTLANNPSHLEAVNPVVEGMARAKQDLIENEDKAAVLPLLLHGDAAFSGQGVTAETLNMSQLEGYSTKGTIHIIINNQIGYTTLPEDARSTRYSTDVAKNLMIPIFHVHGENPEAVVHVARLASDYRKKFKKDVVIDVVCYRRYGHNEGDEPYFTQPLMYDRIKERPPLYELYQNDLIRNKLIEKSEADKITKEVVTCLDESFEAAKENQTVQPKTPFKKKTLSTKSNISREQLVDIAQKLYQLPAGLNAHPKLSKLMKNRLSAITEGKGIDWANGEILAFATLLSEGVTVRLSGQDCQRGTFSQRHSVLTDSVTNEKYNLVNSVSSKGSQFYVYNSHLSESGVMGFEYGYTLGNPDCLVMWEAQFGDFANGAQIMIDQFISSGESKWQNKSRLTLLLPHGYEGQGPEHSSARLERFLQLCAENNIRVCYPSTPSQYYHLLRRQITDDEIKPLVVMTPKSLLRNPLAVSNLNDFLEGPFQTVLEDDPSHNKPQKMLLCSGKIYYELMKEREASKAENVGITRVEQLYPFPEDALKKIIEKNKSVKKWVWVQEEPQNMGAFSYIHPKIKNRLNIDLAYIGRKASASPVTGYAAIFRKEQDEIIKGAIGE